MKGYIVNIEETTEDGHDFRRVLYTGKHSQLVVMSLEVGEEIGEEVHSEIDQFIRVEKGEGMVIIDGIKHRLSDGFAAVIPAGAKHNVINTSDQPMKIYTIYSPAEHRDGVVHQIKIEAVADSEHFDGRTTE